MTSQTQTEEKVQVRFLAKRLLKFLGDRNKLPNILDLILKEDILEMGSLPVAGKKETYDKCVEITHKAMTIAEKHHVWISDVIRNKSNSQYVRRSEEAMLGLIFSWVNDDLVIRGIDAIADAKRNGGAVLKFRVAVPADHIKEALLHACLDLRKLWGKK